ncbi:DUF222 domain-containing protein [Mycobacterium manitobense]|uniref:DUF222 domain-containing protein n=1 Tax=[Mycobacterium] manitobense TaxID=190147 RepID=A0A9X2YN85_9MYCO|nr:HNH endonuclease signature motif containing protein [[Mycobacterium] manitobense]MCV7171058.1 DUF222 domain-containing protein [[Mycobacterium] manitobense]
MDGDVVAALQAWDDARAGLAALPLNTLDVRELLAVYERRQHAHRQDAAIDHTVLATLADRFTAADFGGTGLKDVLAQRLHLDTADAKRRLDAAGMLGPRWTFTGEELPAQWDATSAALAEGLIDPAHVEVIRKFFTKLPPWVDHAARADAERDLARWAQGMCPEDLQQLADHLVEVIDPDGAEPDHDTQQARRGLKMGRQRRDGMTPVSGHLDPEARALFDVVFAKLAAPGQNLPADPGAAEANSAAAFGGDPRTREQRQHDALKTALRDVVGSGVLGQVNGLPATIVATTTVGDLEAGTGYTHTAGGTRLPIRDLIRMAGQSRHYLAVFDDHTEEILYLGRARRCATTAQRLALFARDRGCTRPGCTAPAYQTQVHHAQRDWAEGGRTDIDELALACQPDNNLIEQTEWTTRRRNGRTEWIPSPSLDTGQHRTNNYHHPRRHLTDRDDDAEPA